MTTSKKSRGKVGVVGLGIIGTRVAANLRSAGHQVYVWSRTPRAAPNFLGSVVEVADLCDAMQLFVSDDQALEEVIRTVAAALRPRHVVLCHATVSPDATRRAAKIVESQGARYLDAPFTGSKGAAQNKQLVYYIGGAKPALEEVRPLLEATAKAVLHVGGVGDASVLKIATNMLTASTVQTLAEALALVRAAGIDASKLVEALENNASRSGTSDLKLPAMIAANTEPNFSLKHMLKDVRFAQQLADKYELSLPVTDTTADVLELGIQNDWGDEDFSVVAKLYPVPVTAVPPPAKTAPKPEPSAPKPDAVTPKPAPPADPSPKAEAKPAETPAKPAVTEAQPPKADSEKTPEGAVLPPRPVSNGKAEEKAPVSTPTEPTAKPAATAEPIPAEKKDAPPMDLPKKPALEPSAAPVSKAEPSPAVVTAPSTPAEPSSSPVPNGEAGAKRTKKSTLQMIRGLFKHAETKGR